MKRILMLVICLLLCSCSLEDTVFKSVILDEDGEPVIKELKLTMVGDALVHPAIYKDAYENGRYNFVKMFESTKDIFEDSDLMYYNQETILGGEALGYSGYPRFNTPDDFGRTMIGLGFNLVSRANNHTLDKGTAGIMNACNFWNRFENVLTAGSVCTEEEAKYPKILERNGIKYALLSYTTSTNGLKSDAEYYVSVYSDELARREIKALREDVDVLLVAMHWGDEYATSPTKEQIRVSKYLANLGVDVVIGTHPHVIEPVRWIGKTLVIYSLGNFISNQSAKDNYDRKVGLVVHVDIRKIEFQGKSKVELKDLNTELVYTYSESDKNFRIIPFSKLTEDILPDYRNIKTKYYAIIMQYDNNIDTN